MSQISERHAVLAARFEALAGGVDDWDAPSPVPGWAARDVVHHLAGWLPGFLTNLGLPLPSSATEEPVALWRAHSAAVQSLLEDPARAGQILATGMGPMRADETLERFYLADIYLHSWDLAKASGQAVGWDPAETLATFAAMSPAREMLAASGQFGTPVLLDESHSPEERLVALIGRDPAWAPPGH